MTAAKKVFGVYEIFRVLDRLIPGCPNRTKEKHFCAFTYASFDLLQKCGEEIKDIESAAAAICFFGINKGYLKHATPQSVAHIFNYTNKDVKPLIDFLERNIARLDIDVLLSAWRLFSFEYFREGSPVLELAIDYGWSPIDVYAQFYLDGKVVFYYYNFDSVQRHEFSFDNVVLNKMVKVLIDMGFLSLKKDWSPQVRDDNVFTLILNQGGMSNRISADSGIFELPDFPDDLKKVLNQLDSWVNERLKDIEQVNGVFNSEMNAVAHGESSSDGRLFLDFLEKNKELISKLDLKWEILALERLPEELYSYDFRIGYLTGLLWFVTREITNYLEWTLSERNVSEELKLKAKNLKNELSISIFNYYSCKADFVDAKPVCIEETKNLEGRYSFFRKNWVFAKRRWGDSSSWMKDNYLEAQDSAKNSKEIIRNAKAYFHLKKIADSIWLEHHIQENIACLKMELYNYVLSKVQYSSYGNIEGMNPSSVFDFMSLIDKKKVSPILKGFISLHPAGEKCLQVVSEEDILQMMALALANNYLSEKFSKESLPLSDAAISKFLEANQDLVVSMQAVLCISEGDYGASINEPVNFDAHSSEFSGSLLEKIRRDDFFKAAISPFLGSILKMKGDGTAEIFNEIYLSGKSFAGKCALSREGVERLVLLLNRRNFMRGKKWQ